MRRSRGGVEGARRRGALLAGAPQALAFVALAGLAALAPSLSACRRDSATSASTADGAVASQTPADGAVASQTHDGAAASLAVGGAATALAVGDAGSSPPADRFSEAALLAEGAAYLDDADFRRSALTASLSNPTNIYSRQRLESYGLKTRGWDLLPAWTPQSIPVTTAMAADVRAHRALVLDPSAPRLWDGTRPTTMAGWVTLGREVFFGYPLRVEIFMNWAFEHPDVGERLGVRAGADGVYPGVRLFANVDGKAALGITCAVCHTSVGAAGKVVVGEARRAFDYGALRNAYHAQTGVRVDPELARRMASWGPGRADVTEDDDEDPVAIPDLWGLKHQSALTQAGTIKHVGVTALAIRQETQLLHSNHQKIRPPRELALALALFLYSLDPAKEAGPGATASSGSGASGKPAAHGKELFADHCEKCHSNAAFGGPPVAADKVGTDRALAFGAARGTGKYRPPALLRVAQAAPYFHDGSVPTLEDVLSPARLEPSYAKSPVTKGPVAGHTYGTELPAADRAALVAYLRTL